MKSSRDVLSRAARGTLATVFVVFVHTLIVLSEAVRPPWTHYTDVDLHRRGQYLLRKRHATFCVVCADSTTPLIPFLIKGRKCDIF